MEIESQPEPESVAGSALSSSATVNWRAWRSRVRWSILVVATAICVAFSGQGGLEPVVIGAIFLASAVSSIAGFAFSAVCGAMLFHLAGDPVQIVQIMIVCSIANQTAMVYSLRRAIRWRELAPFLIGGAFGLPVGIAVLLKLDRHLYTHALGVFLGVYGCYMLVRKPLVIGRQKMACDVLAGFFGGITGGAAGFPGAFVTIWCGFKGWSKERQRAMFQPFIHAGRCPRNDQSVATFRRQGWVRAGGLALHTCCASRNRCWHDTLQAAVRQSFRSRRELADDRLGDQLLRVVEPGTEAA